MELCFFTRSSARGTHGIGAALVSMQISCRSTAAAWCGIGAGVCRMPRTTAERSEPIEGNLAESFQAGVFLLSVNNPAHLLTHQFATHRVLVVKLGQHAPTPETRDFPSTRPRMARCKTCWPYKRMAQLRDGLHQGHNQSEIFRNSEKLRHSSLDCRPSFTVIEGRR